jgi:hypothetical protein
MAIEDILKTLKPEDAAAVKQWHDDDVSAETEKGKTDYRKRSSEVNKFRDENKKLRDFLKTNFEFDPDGDLEQQFKEAEENLKKQGSGAGDGKPNAEFEEFKKKNEKELKQLRDALAAEKAEKEAVTLRAKNGKISNLLSESMKDIPSAPFVIKDFLNSKRVDLDESGEKVVFVEGDDRIELPKALEKFRKENPHLVVINQNGGSGSSGQRQNIPGAKQMRNEDWLKLPGKERAAFINSGGTTF